MVVQKCTYVRTYVRTYTFVCTAVRNIAPPAPWLRQCQNYEPNDSDDDDADGDGDDDDDDDDEDERTTRTTNLNSPAMSESPPASHWRLFTANQPLLLIVYESEYSCGFLALT